jgi:hypothetical protein
MPDNPPPKVAPPPSWQGDVSATGMTRDVKLTRPAEQLPLEPPQPGIERTGTAAHDNLITAAREQPASAMPPPPGGWAAQPYVPPDQPQPQGSYIYQPPAHHGAHPPPPPGAYPPPPVQQQQSYSGLESGASLSHQVSYGGAGTYGSMYHPPPGYTGQDCDESLQRRQSYAGPGSSGSQPQQRGYGGEVPHEHSYGGAGFGPPPLSYMGYGVSPPGPPPLQPGLITRASHSTGTGRRESVSLGSGLVRISMELHGTGLAKMDWFGLSDPYVIISRLGDAEPHEVHRTECIKKNLNPKWEPFYFVHKALAGEQKSKAQFEFRVMDWDQFKSDDEIGTAVATLEELEKGPLRALYHSKKRDKKKPKKMGELVVVKCNVDHLYM